jgi:hypothetical protein
MAFRLWSVEKRIPYRSFPPPQPVFIHHWRDFTGFPRCLRFAIIIPNNRVKAGLVAAQSGHGIAKRLAPLAMPQAVRPLPTHTLLGALPVGKASFGSIGGNHFGGHNRPFAQWHDEDYSTDARLMSSV